MGEGLRRNVEGWVWEGGFSFEGCFRAWEKRGRMGESMRYNVSGGDIF